MSDQSIKSKTVRGLIWSTIDKFAFLIISFLIGLVLARMLMPADYGLVGMLGFFMAISQVLVTSGFSTALVQKHTPSDEDYSTVFYFNLGIAVGLYLILFVSAPYIAAFYKSPQLIQITRVLSLSIIINSLSLVQQTRLRISLNFKTQAKISLIAVLISGCLGVWAAYQGYGVWSLVILNLSSDLLKMILLFYFNRWMPTLVFSIQSFKSLFRFSSRILAASLVSNLVTHMYSILIGRHFSARELGFYTNAKQYPEYLSSPIGTVLLGVSYPVLASLKNEKENMVTVYSRLMRGTVFFIMPLLTLFAILSESFIRLFLTEKWISIVPLIQWMSFTSLLAPLCSLNMMMISVIGRSDIVLKVELLKLPITITTLMITIPMGLKAVVIGHLISITLTYFITAFCTGKFFDFGAIKQLQAISKIILATIIMAVVAFTCSYFITNDFLKLLLGGLVGIAIYFITAFLMKIEELNDIKELIQNNLLNKLNSSKKTE
jgi:O-antigen/teichoic acid export membrane protein